MLDYLGYRPMPEYVDFALVDWPRYYEASLARGYDFDATGRRVAVAAPEGYVQAMGVESLTLIGSATVAGGRWFIRHCSMQACKTHLPLFCLRPLLTQHK